MPSMMLCAMPLVKFSASSSDKSTAEKNVFHHLGNGDKRAPSGKAKEFT
jgi:hypothetical protein